VVADSIAEDERHTSRGERVSDEMAIAAAAEFDISSKWNVVDSAQTRLVHRCRMTLF
jgi:hypothetical protein